MLKVCMTDTARLAASAAGQRSVSIILQLDIRFCLMFDACDLVLLGCWRLGIQKSAAASPIQDLSREALPMRKCFNGDQESAFSGRPNSSASVHILEKAVFL